MTKQKTTGKTKRGGDRAKDVATQLEQAFLAGLGALSNAQDAGSDAFQKLIKQGKSFREETSNKTESLIGDVQDAIRDMSTDAQSKATGLLEQMRETPQMEKIQGVFDARVAGALERIGVASTQSIDDLNAKLDRVLQAVEQKKTPKPRKKAARKTARKAAPKKAARKTTRKAAPKKAAGKTTRKAPAKKAPARRSAKKVSKKGS